MIKECLLGFSAVLLSILLSLLAMKSKTEQIEHKIEVDSAAITNSINELRMSIQELDDAIKQQRQMIQHFDYIGKYDI